MARVGSASPTPWSDTWDTFLKFLCIYSLACIVANSAVSIVVNEGGQWISTLGLTASWVCGGGCLLLAVFLLLGQRILKQQGHAILISCAAAVTWAVCWAIAS